MLWLLAATCCLLTALLCLAYREHTAYRRARAEYRRALACLFGPERDHDEWVDRMIGYGLAGMATVTGTWTLSFAWAAVRG